MQSPIYHLPIRRIPSAFGINFIEIETNDATISIHDNIFLDIFFYQILVDWNISRIFWKYFQKKSENISTFPCFSSRCVERSVWVRRFTRPSVRSSLGWRRRSTSTVWLTTNTRYTPPSPLSGRLTPWHPDTTEFSFHSRQLIYQISIKALNSIKGWFILVFKPN